MAQFIDPFLTVVPERHLTKRELARCLRQAVASEYEAIHLYEALADAADDKVAKAVLQDIANEERVHAGEFQRLICRMLDDEAGYMAEGATEVDDLAARVEGCGAKPCVEPCVESCAASKKPIPVPGALK